MAQTPAPASEALDRVRAYLDAIDAVPQGRAGYADTIHGLDDHVLTRSDLRALLAAAEQTRPALAAAWQQGIDDLGRSLTSPLDARGMRPAPTNPYTTTSPSGDSDQTRTTP